MQAKEQAAHLLKCPRPDMLRGATENIIELLGNGKTLWKYEIVAALCQYEETAVESGLYRLYHHYGLVQRDDFNLYSLSELGCKYYELIFEKEEAEDVRVERLSVATTTTTTNSNGRNEEPTALGNQIQARSSPDSQSCVLKTDSKQLEPYSKGTRNDLKTTSRVIDFGSEWITKPSLGQNHPEITLERDRDGQPRVGEAGSGSSSPIVRSRRTYFEPLNGGERLSFQEAIKDWIAEASPSAPEIRIVTGLKDYLFSQNRVVTKLVASEEAAAEAFGMSLQEFREAWKKLYSRRQVCFGTFSGQAKMGFLLEWTDLLRHGIWRPERDAETRN